MSTEEKAGPAPAVMDRQAYLRAIRREMLKTLGLPEEAKPERVSLLLQIKARLDNLKEPAQELGPASPDPAAEKKG